MKLLIYRTAPQRMFFIHKTEDECGDSVGLFNEMDTLRGEHPDWEIFIIDDTNRWTTYHLTKEKKDLTTPLDK